MNGKAFFDKLCANPARMPKDSEFEAVLYVAGQAHEKKTGRPLVTRTRYSYETFSNKAGWRARGTKRRAAVR